VGARSGVIECLKAVGASVFNTKSIALYEIMRVGGLIEMWLACAL